MLDTNIVSDLGRNPQGKVAMRLALVGIGVVAISIIVTCEVEFGFTRLGTRGASGTRYIKNMRQIFQHIPMLEFASPAEEHYADIRNQLERAGKPIGPNDLLIAAHARALGCTLVTNNVREFKRVPKLTVENWLV